MDYEKILKDNEKMIWKIASHFYGVDKYDLFQAGALGILKALKKYRTNGTTKFSSYAYDYIFGEMYELANCKELKVSKDILKLYKKIEEARYHLAQKYAKLPNNQELAEFLNISKEDIDFATLSANKLISLDESNSDTRELYDCLPARSEDVDLRILLESSLDILDEDEKNIIKSRYFEDLTQSEVARKLKMTQVMVSRYEKKSIGKMREYLTL